MKAKEFVKKGILSTKYALGVSIGAESDNHMASELGEVSDVIAQWSGDRGKAATQVMLTIVAPESDHPLIEQRVRTELAAIATQLPIEVTLVGTAASDKEKTFTLR